jgi:hypothetical protein
MVSRRCVMFMRLASLTHSARLAVFGFSSRDPSEFSTCGEDVWTHTPDVHHRTLRSRSHCIRSLFGLGRHDDARPANNQHLHASDFGTIAPGFFMIRNNARELDIPIGLRLHVEEESLGVTSGPLDTRKLTCSRSTSRYTWRSSASHRRYRRKLSQW